MRKKIAILFTLLIFFGHSSYAACKASISLGSECKDEEGYIHVPKNYKHKSDNSLCSKKYQIFNGNELPKVGSVAHPTIVLMFYQNLNEINERYKKCELEAKDFKRKDLFGRNDQEARECLIDICMTAFDKHSDFASGDDDILGWSNELKIISYEYIDNDLFALIKVTK